MSSEQSESVAIAFLVESSLSVALEWRKKISEYSSCLLKRVSDSHPTSKPRVAFVTYGTADTVPTPILCKRFFADFAVVFKEMEDLSRLGIGMTNSGGTRGMAALEGFVATLELFDILQSYSPVKEGSSHKPIVSHIIHIADASPDASQHPSWNDSAALDNVDWDSLPLEMKKRNIQYNAISLRPNLPRFSELHAAVVTGGSTPWFNVHAPHTVLLAPFPAPQSKASPTKRPNDLSMEPESKRPRIQPSTESPKPAAKAVTSQTQTIIPPVTQPPRAVPTAPSQSLTLPIAATSAKTKHQMVMERLRSAGEQLQQLESQISAAKSEGKTELAESLMQEYTSKKAQHLKVTQTLSQQFMAVKQAVQASAQGYPQREVVAPPFGLNNGTNSLSTGNLPSSSSNLSLGSDLTSLQHSRSLSETTFPTTTTAPATSAAPSDGASNMSVQMQKIIEQQQQQQPRMRPAHAASQSLGGIPTQNIASAAMRPDGPSHFSATPPSHLPHQPEPAGNATRTVAVWNGSLNWSGQGTSGKKEVRAYVVASTANVPMCHANTWPKAFTLVPTREPEVSMADLQAWLKQHKPALCTFQVQNNIPDAKTNENNYRSLVQLLTMRKGFATAAWTTPSGGQTKNVLVFPVGSGLAGAFFALTGLPELPKPISATPAFNIPPALAAKMRDLNPEQQAVVVAQLQRHRQQQQQALAAQQQFSHNQDVNGAVPFAPAVHPPNHANMNAVLNMMNTQASGPTMIPMNAPQPSFPNTLPRSGLNNPNAGVQGVSYEMMQSFVQRNADGNVSMK